MRDPARFPSSGNFIEDALIFARQKTCAIDHHVDFVGAIVDRAADFPEFQFCRHQSGRKSGRDRGDFNAGALEKFFRDSNEIWIDANGRATRRLVAGIEGLHGFAAKKGDFSWSVAAFERGQVHHRDHQLQAFDLGRSFDASSGEGGGPFFRHHLIDARHAPARSLSGRCF